MKQAEAASDAQDFVTAKTCYLVAKDIYASLKMEDEVEGLTRKIEVLDIKAGLAE